jgi:NTP pyrophosphatase (non-canonical NTP hydrolase)
MTRQEVFELVEKERLYQNKKWQRKDNEWDRPDTTKLTVLAEEFGEVARAILENNPGNLKEELVQVAAVSVAWLESLK